MNDLPLFLRRYVQSLAGCAYFFAGGVLLRKHRGLLYALCKHFGFETEIEDPRAKPAPTVPKISAAEIIRDETAVNLSRISAKAKSGKIVQLYGDSGTFDFSPYSGHVDLMFVDGAHSYEYVLSDSDAAHRMVKPGGLILWHDYDSRWFPGVTRALNQLQAQDARFTGIRHIENTALCFMVR